MSLSLRFHYFMQLKDSANPNPIFVLRMESDCVGWTAEAEWAIEWERQLDGRNWEKVPEVLREPGSHAARPAPDGSASDAEWGRVLWDWLREMLPYSGCCLEIDTEDLMRLAEKHGRARKVEYNPDIHGGGMCDAEPGDEIWWWGDQGVSHA